MGISSSCPFAEHNDVEASLESVIVRSISFGYDEGETPTRTVSFGCQDLEPMIMTSLGSGKMTVERSVSFKGSELEKMMSVKSSLLDKESDTSEDLTDCANDNDTTGQSLSSANCIEAIPRSPVFDSSNPKHLAALKLQKVYKSFRTRRKLADCAVLVEQSWWELLDFAELKRSSVSFFGIEKHETAISRWSRARTRAAKVGKGLSKNGKARKLALQHWLEAIDPRHRYGHNLHFYYVNWLHSKSREPFFYWLDIGEGKEVNLERCSRSKLQLQCIKYLGPIERLTYEVVVENGLLLYKQTGELLNSTDDAKWIFVLSTSKNLYVGKKQKGRFQHSSFLAGGVTLAAGRLIVESGVLKAVWPHSGHYKPTEENFKDFISFLRENNVDLTDVKTSSLDEEEGSERSSKHIRCNSSDEDLIQTFKGLGTEEVLVQGSTLEHSDLLIEETSTTLHQQKSRQSHYLGKKLTNLVIPKRGELEFVNPSKGPILDDTAVESAVSDDYESAKEGFGTEQLSVVPKQILFDEQEENGVGKISKIGVLERINSNPRMMSYQLGRQLSCKWTTGAGPRIGCVTNSPTELKFRALEQVNLSPRSGCDSRRSSLLSRKISAPSSFGNGVSPIDYLPQGSALISYHCPYKPEIASKSNTFFC